MPHFSIRLMLLALLFSGASVAQNIQYISDKQYVPLRSGSSNEHRIVRMVPTGAELTVLEERDGWSRVRLPGESGDEAWILTRFLRDDPPPRQALADAPRWKWGVRGSTQPLRRDALPLVNRR